MENKLNRKGWLFIVPVLILLAAFLLYPIIFSFYLSLTSTKGIVSEFVGFGNYKRIVNDPMFWLALKNTGRILLIQVPIMLIIAIVLASILNDKSLKGRGFFRTAIFLPAVTSLIAYTILFKMLFAYDGMINSLLMKIHVITEPITWLTSTGTATFVLIIAMIWRWTGYNMVFYLSAMQNISSDIYEAAKVDGANKVQTFFRITLPQLKPMILFTTVMSTIGTLQLFDEPMNLSQGGTTAATMGPGNVFLTLSVYIYNVCFKYQPNFGYAATISYVIVIIIGILSLIQFKLGESDDKKDERKFRKMKAIQKKQRKLEGGNRA
jgi:lactose/L-arabinose transport system permease protein